MCQSGVLSRGGIASSPRQLKCVCYNMAFVVAAIEFQSWALQLDKFVVYATASFLRFLMTFEPVLELFRRFRETFTGFLHALSQDVRARARAVSALCETFTGPFQWFVAKIGNALGFVRSFPISFW